MNLFNRFQQWIRLYTTSYEDRRWRTLCIVRGEFIQKVQSHWDGMQGSWVYKEVVVQIYYTLRYNNIGQHDCLIDSSASLNHKLLRDAPEYIQIIYPWTNGDIDNDKLKDIYMEYPDRVSFPCAGVVNLPPLRANDNLLIPAGTSSEMRVITSSSGAA